MRESNNQHGKIQRSGNKNDYVFYVIHDPDTGEYLTGPDHWEDLSERDDEDFSSAFDLDCRFDSLTATMREMQETVGPDLVDRFPDEVIRLGVDRVVESIIREFTLDLEPASEVQTWGEELEAPARTNGPRTVDYRDEEEDEDEDELVDEDEDPPAARPRSGYVDFSNDFYASLAGKSSKKANKVKKRTKGKSRK
jgi:hypothetical protein